MDATNDSGSSVGLQYDHKLTLEGDRSLLQPPGLSGTLDSHRRYHLDIRIHRNIHQLGPTAPRD